MRAVGRRRVLLAILPASFLLGALWLCLVRVPGDALAVAGGKVLPPGTHFTLPWRAVSYYPREGARISRDAAALTPEGARVQVRYSLHARPDPGRADLLPERSAGPDSGFDDDLARLVESALVRPGTDEPRLRAESSLRASGMEILSLSIDRADASRLRPPIALIGLDGADWQIIDPLITAGRLPHLAALKAKGRWGTLRSYEPILSPLLWTTAVTGKPPDEHGIIDFLAADPVTGARAPITSRSRKVKALWNIFSDHGLSVGVVAWWASWPSESVRGRIVSDRVAYSLFEVAEAATGLTWPPDLERALRPEITQAAAITHAEIARYVSISPQDYQAARVRAAADPNTAYKEPVNHLARILAATRTYHRAALRLLEEGQPDLFAVYYQGIDEVGHRFAHFVPPRLPQVTDRDVARYGKAVEEFYVHQDELLGELISKLAPGTRVVVMSDHGFHNGASRPRDTAADIEGKPAQWHRLYGILMAAGEGIEPGRFDAATLYDIAPTVLALAGLPRARDMKGTALIAAPVERPEIATYETPRPEGDLASRRAHSPSSDASTADDELLRNLASLGYIGSQGAAPSTAAASAPGLKTVTSHTNLAAVLAQKGDLKGAEAELRQALSRSPGYFPALMSLGQILVRQDRLDEALEVTRRAVARAEDADTASYLQLAILAWRAKQAPQASSFFSALRARRPKSPGPDTGLGVLAAAAGDRAAAERHFRAALAIDPSAPEPMGRLFMMYRERGREIDLAAEVETALAENDRSVLHLNWMGLIRARRGEIQEAESHFRRALDLAPDFAGTAANLGSLYARAGRLEEAVAILSRAVRIEPRNLEARVNLGGALAKLGRLEEAIASLKEARAMGLRSPELLNAIGFACAESGRHAEAIEVLRESLSVAPGQPQVEALLADLTRSS